MIYCKTCNESLGLDQLIKTEAKAFRVAHCDFCLSETGPFFEWDDIALARVLAALVQLLRKSANEQPGPVLIGFSSPWLIP